MIRKYFRLISLSAIAVLITIPLLELLLKLFAFTWQPVYQTIFDDPNRTYIYMLGESTSRGQPYQEKINPTILVSYQFNDSLQGRPTQIIELGQFGQTIQYNYFKFYFELLFRPHKNALVLIYSGINEATSNSDDPQFEHWKKIQRSIILSKLFSTLSSANSPQRYRYRYEQVLLLAKNHGYKTVISQLVGNITGYDPDVSDDDILLKPGYIDLFTKANLLFETADYPSSESLYRALLNKLDHQHPYLIYRIAHCKYQEHQYDSARFYFGILPEISNYNGYAHWKNEILARVANTPGVALAHTFERFVDSSENGLPGYNLVLDAHHPNLRGYCILSRELAGEVSKLYNEKIKRDISEDIVKQHFSFDNEFQCKVNYKIVEWFIYEAFQTQLRSNRLQMLKFYLAGYEQGKPDDEIISLWKLLVAIMQKDEPEIAACMHKISTGSRKTEMTMRLKDGFGNRPYKTEIIDAIMSVHFADANDAHFAEELASALR